MYTINAFRKNKVSGYCIGIGGMIGKLYFNINLTFSICGLILQLITFRNIDSINCIVMVLSTIYLSILLITYSFSKIHGFLLLFICIMFVTYNLYFAKTDILS